MKKNDRNLGKSIAMILVAAVVILLSIGIGRCEAQVGSETISLTGEGVEKEKNDWNFEASIVPPGISIDFDEWDKVRTGFNAEEGGAGVSLSKGKGLRALKFGLDSYFRFVEGESSNVGFGFHVEGLEKNGWSLLRIAVVGWIDRSDDIDWSLIVGIGLPSVYKRE